jgi:hypothetical protein
MVAYGEQYTQPNPDTGSKKTEYEMRQHPVLKNIILIAPVGGEIPYYTEDYLKGGQAETNSGQPITNEES